MRIIPPITITPAKFTSSTAAEPHAPSAYNALATYDLGAIALVAADFSIYESLDSGNLGNAPGTSPIWWRRIGPTETAYDVGATYALGDTVSSASSHRCYESRQAANIGKPLPVLPETETDWWIDLGPTNKWAAIDLDTNTQTVTASPQTIVITPGQRVNSIFLGGMVADLVTITATSVYGGGPVYSYSRDLRTRIATTPTEYYFKPFKLRPNDYVFDIPPVSDIVITITLTRASGNVKLGSAIFGLYTYIGPIVEKAREEKQNFGRVIRDDYARATIIRRRSVPSIVQQVKVDHADLDKVRALGDDLNGIVCAWIGMENSSHALADALAKIGFYVDFDFDHESNYSILNLRVQEL